MVLEWRGEKMDVREDRARGTSGHLLLLELLEYKMWPSE